MPPELQAAVAADGQPLAVGAVAGALGCVHRRVLST